jgi:hypothetical protein
MSDSKANNPTDQDKLKDILNKAKSQYTDNNSNLILKLGKTEVAFLFNVDGRISTI